MLSELIGVLIIVMISAGIIIGVVGFAKEQRNLKRLNEKCWRLRDQMKGDE